LDFGLGGNPSGNVFLKTFLNFESFSDNDDWSLRENVMKQGGEKWLSRLADAGAR